MANEVCMAIQEVFSINIFYSYVIESTEIALMCLEVCMYLTDLELPFTSEAGAQEGCPRQRGLLGAEQAGGTDKV